MRDFLSIRNPQIKAGVAVFALTFFLLAHLLSWSASFHHAVHDEAHHAEHQCAVTLLQNGQIDISEAEAVLTPVAITFSEVALPIVTFVSSAPYLLPQERGPPALA
ncbi:MAG: hypothetical protein ACK4UN_21765 [Limisphaerales bacterium]